MGEKMFWVPLSVLENLVSPVSQQENEEALARAKDILSGKVEARPVLTPTKEEVQRYLKSHESELVEFASVMDEVSLAIIAKHHGARLVKDENLAEVREESVEHKHSDVAMNLKAHLEDTRGPHVRNVEISSGIAQRQVPDPSSVRKEPTTSSEYDERGIIHQTNGTPRLCLGVNRDLNVTADTQQLEVVLGTFNTDKSLTPHHVYRIAPDELKAQMDKLVDKPIGEIGQSQFGYNESYANLLCRMENTDIADAWAILAGYRIEELADSSLRVHGTVSLTNRGRVMIADTHQALCSIRSVSMQQRSGVYPDVILNNVKKICAFDLVAE